MLAEQRERDNRTFIDALGRVARACGAGIEVLKAQMVHGYGWNVTMRVWVGHGIASVTEMTLRFHGRPAVLSAEFAEAVIVKNMSKRLEQQAELTKQFGAVRIVAPDEVDLSIIRIERPIAACAIARHGTDAIRLIREAVASGTDFVMVNPQPRVWGVNDDIVVGVKRGELRGVFEVRTDNHNLRWARGSLTISGIRLPGTIMATLQGRMLGEVIEHPLFDPCMEITSAHLAGTEPRPKLVLTLKNTTMEALELVTACS